MNKPDGVAMGLPLGPLMAITFMCSIEDQLQEEGKLPEFHKRYVDDTLSIMPNVKQLNHSFPFSMRSIHLSASPWNLMNTSRVQQ